MGKLNFAIATVLLFALCACSSNKKQDKKGKTEETEKKIGKYVYMDTNKKLIRVILFDKRKYLRNI